MKRLAIVSWWNGGCEEEMFEERFQTKEEAEQWLIERGYSPNMAEMTYGEEGFDIVEVE